MAAGNFDASKALLVQENLERMFPRGTAIQNEFMHPVMTAKLILENHGASVNPVLEDNNAGENGENCLGYKVYFMQVDDEGVDYSDTELDATLDCDTPVGVEGQTNSKLYQNNMHIYKTVRVKDATCKDEVDFAMKSATMIKKAILEIRKELNERMISFLSANAQVNLDTGMPATWDDTTAAPRIQIPSAEWKWDLLGLLDVHMEMNDIENYHFINGRNFRQEVWVGDYMKLNADSKEAAAAFNAYNLHWDTKNVDRVLGRSATIGFDPNVLAFWNTTWGTGEAVQTDEHTWEYIISDPELRYMKNGQLVPVQYMVEYKKTCMNRNAHTKKVWAHDYFIRLIGGYDIAPTGLQGETRIVEFEKVA